MLQLEQFFKVFGDEGIQFIRVEDTDDRPVEELYKGLEVTRVQKISGYGIPVAEHEYVVFNDPVDARRFESVEIGFMSPPSTLPYDELKHIRQRQMQNVFNS